MGFTQLLIKLYLPLIFTLLFFFFCYYVRIMLTSLTE